MKKYLFIVLATTLILNSCEKLDKEVFFTIGSEHEYKYSDIELYDTSTHILYFKNEQEYFKDIYENTFSFFDNRQIIYQGCFWPGYSGSMPEGPFIMSPPLHGNYSLRIYNLIPGEQDIRKNQKMINVLSRHNLLHSGLVISSGSLDITETQITFRFTVTNQDQSNLMIIDLDKTGPNLFHYFTYGLNIYDMAQNEVFSSTIEHQAPDPWDSWDIEWLSELKSGDSKEFTITYILNTPMNPGEYNATFKFPGLGYHITKDQLYQGNSRIWFGDITLNKNITIE
jgi:hypothetical protein